MKLLMVPGWKMHHNKQMLLPGQLGGVKILELVNHLFQTVSLVDKIIQELLDILVFCGIPE